MVEVDQYSGKIRQFDLYVRACKKLKNDIEVLLDDHRFLSEGGRIEYAVDFSEIYAFLKPVETSSEMSLFPAEEVGDSFAAQAFALNEIFFRTQKGVFVPEPYLLELKSFIETLRVEEAQSIAESFLHSFHIKERILADPEGVRLLAVAAEVKKTSRQLSAEEIVEFADFFEREARYLRLWEEGVDLRPLARLRSLLRSGRLLDVRDIEGSRQPEQQRVEFWFEELKEARSRKKKKRSSDFLDALAVATVEDFNRENGDRFRVLLISRSFDIGEAVRKVVQRDGGLNFVRPSRSFSAFHLGRERSIADRERWWRRQVGALSLFLESVAGQHEPLRELQGNRGLDSAGIVLEAILEDWKVSESLLASLEGGYGLENASRRGEGLAETKARVLVDLLTGSTELRRQLLRRLEEIEESIAREHEFFGWYLETHDGEARSRLQEAVVVSRYGLKTVLTLASGLEATPFSVQFYSEDLRVSGGKGTEDGSHLTWDRVAGIFRESGFGESTFERLLAMGFCLAALNKWDLAEKYCRQGLEIEEVPGADGVILPRNEGYFFLAVCMRNGSRSAARFEEAMRALDAATTIKAIEVRKDSEYCDPRYLRERATQIFVYHEEVRARDLKWDGDFELPSVEVAVSLSRQALDILKDDVPLRIWTLNNLCYYYSSVEPVDPEVAGFYLDELKKCLSGMFKGVATWPSRIANTVAWASIALGYNSLAAAELDRHLAVIKESMHSAQIPERDVAKIRRQLRLAEEMVSKGADAKHGR